jgi:hypothetical protein
MWTTWLTVLLAGIVGLILLIAGLPAIPLLVVVLIVVGVLVRRHVLVKAGKAPDLPDDPPATSRGVREEPSLPELERSGVHRVTGYAHRGQEHMTPQQDDDERS